MPERNIDISRGFNIGRQMAPGPSPFAAIGGGFAGGLLDRFNQFQQMRLQMEMAQRMLGGIGTAAPSVPPSSSPTGTFLSPSSTYTPQYGITGASIDPFNPGATKYTYGEIPQSQMSREIALKRGEERSAQQVNASAAVNALKNVVSNFKAMRNVTGGAGRVAGVKTGLSGFLGEQASTFGLPVNPYVKSYDSALTDAAVSIGRISAPNARIGPDFINAFKSTLSNAGMTDQELYGKVNANVRQILGRVAAENGQPIDEQQIQELTDHIISTNPADFSQRPQSLFQPVERGTDVESIKARLRAKYGTR